MGHTGNDRSEVLDFIPAESRTFLDVGCSDGLFAQSLQRTRNAIVDGIESDPVAADRGRQYFRDIQLGFFPEVLTGRQNYDCVTFLDCLEHMYEPWVALEEARHLLSPTGCVVASIPNVRHIRVLETLIRHRDWPWEDQNIFDRTHVRWFTKKSIARMFEDCGFTVLRLEPINVWNNPKTRVARIVLGADVAATQFVVVAVPAS